MALICDGAHLTFDISMCLRNEPLVEPDSLPPWPITNLPRAQDNTLRTDTHLAKRIRKKRNIWTENMDVGLCRLGHIHWVRCWPVVSVLGLILRTVMILWSCIDVWQLAPPKAELLELFNLFPHNSAPALILLMLAHNAHRAALLTRLGQVE